MVALEEEYIKLIKTEEDIKKEFKDDCYIEKTTIEKIDVEIIGHFGGCISLVLKTNKDYPIANYNNTSNVGYILRTLMYLFEKIEDYGKSIESLNNTRVRLVIDKQTEKVIAIGHITKDKFIIIKDLMSFQRQLDYLLEEVTVSPTNQTQVVKPTNNCLGIKKVIVKSIPRRKHSRVVDYHIQSKNSI